MNNNEKTQADWQSDGLSDNDLLTHITRLSRKEAQEMLLPQFLKAANEMRKLSWLSLKAGFGFPTEPYFAAIVAEPNNLSIVLSGQPVEWMDEAVDRILDTLDILLQNPPPPINEGRVWPNSKDELPPDSQSAS